jgi:hypothetical protein
LGGHTCKIGILDDQIAFFEDALSTSSKTYNFAFTHIPLYARNGEGNSVLGKEEFRDLLASHNVSGAFSGHNHSGHLRVTEQASNGSGLFNIKVQAAYEQGLSFVEVKVTPDNVTVDVIRLDEMGWSGCGASNIVDHSKQPEPPPVTRCPDDPAEPSCVHFLNQVRVAGNGSVYEIDGSQNTTLKAGNKITLLPGFKTHPGAEFQASISFAGIDEPLCR